MSFVKSQYDEGKDENHRQDFHRTGNYRNGDFGYYRGSKKFEFTKSVETNESEDGIVFTIPISLISPENFKVIPEKNYVIIQSNKKTIFINLDSRIELGEIKSTIKEDMLIIEVKKLKL
jgi:hypothetical protein